MERLIIAMVLGLGLAGFAQARGSCEPRLLAELPLEVSPGGDVYVPAKLGGQEVYLQLTLSSGLMFVWESSARALGLAQEVRRGGARFKGGGPPVTHYVKLDELQLGQYRLQARLAPIAPQPGEATPPRLKGKVIAGLMGATLLRNTDAELDLGARRLKLFAPFTCRKQAPVSWGGPVTTWSARFDEAGALVFTLELEGRRIEASLLAGERVSTIDTQVTRRFFGFDETSSGLESEDAGGGPRTLFHAMTLTGSSFSIPDTRVQLGLERDCKLTGSNAVHRAIGYVDCINVVPFVLGADLLERLRIYFSRPRMQVFVSPVAPSTAGD